MMLYLTCNIAYHVIPIDIEYGPATWIFRTHKQDSYLHDYYQSQHYMLVHY